MYLGGDRPRWLIVGGILLAVAAFMYGLYHWCIKERWIRVGKLEVLNIFPLKSGPPIAIGSAECTFFGLRYRNVTDRMFVVFDEERRVLTARTCPNLLNIKMEIFGTQGIAQFVSSSGRDPFKIKMNTIRSMKITYIRMDFPTTRPEIIETRDCGDDAAEWISLELNRPGLRLGSWSHGFRRHITFARQRERDVFIINNSNAGAYSDMSSYNLLNKASLEDLQERLGPNNKVSSDNFRANIIIHQAPPFAEDNWVKMKIGKVIFRIVKPCVRCMMVTINPSTLVEHPDSEPLTTLKTYRKLEHAAQREIEGDSPIMGIHMGLVWPGSLMTGEKVYAWGTPPLGKLLNRIQES
ncbi:unnamed protein product [Nezara viridula]|uniref:MOSC domain-containing protein n=1 Tax=Nezara viridula TaxID=85310 RepID=A0A9P0HKG0_NEZVI|nr:unnamed protein product [Nezara viridula]